MPEQDQQAVLFSDIRDFTSFTARRGDQEAYRIVQTFVNLVEEQVRSQRGKVVKTYGDGVMNTFPNVESGLKAAISMQRALQDYNEANPKSTIAAGIGLNWGEIIRDQDDVFGHSVNMAARLADSAKGGQILVTPAIRSKSESPEDYEFVDLDYRELKGIGRKKVLELHWRDEVSRLKTKNNELNLILTEDNLSIELSKELQNEIKSVTEGIRREAKSESGFTKFILEKVETYVDRYLSRILGWALAKKGIGLEHPIKETRLELKEDSLSFYIRGNEALTLTEEEVEVSSAKKFAKKFRKLKSSCSTNTGGH
ncbi:adenylate/guanylate cyclase domain-containing protein [Candidatus Bipolaricaulota bacterium]|nr:adenylate/guanylate cyclase domain-containing protein [Candidatus Bipolaricaulota bacterium]